MKGREIGCVAQGRAPQLTLVAADTASGYGYVGQNSMYVHAPICKPLILTTWTP